MRQFAVRHQTDKPRAVRRPDRKALSARSWRSSPLGERRGACACGGGCPRCTGEGDIRPTLDGVPAIADFEEAGEMIAIDAPTAQSSAGSSPPSAGTCPTSISVAEILPIELRALNVSQGFHTGVGGVAKMRVGD